MEKNAKKLIMEMAVIILIAAAAGIIWNHRMLLEVWSGKQTRTAVPPPVSAEQAPVPLPAGLLQVREMLESKEAVIVDARSDLAFSEGRIKGALSMPVGEFDARFKDFSKKVPANLAIIVYCSGYGCHDGMTVGKKLMEKGYGQVFVYEGGFPEWKDAGLPIDSGKS
jgi:rhodanese-related sulfurtransferase